MPGENEAKLTLTAKAELSELTAYARAVRDVSQALREHAQAQREANAAGGAPAAVGGVGGAASGAALQFVVAKAHGRRNGGKRCGEKPTEIRSLAQ